MAHDDTCSTRIAYSEIGPDRGCPAVHRLVRAAPPGSCVCRGAKARHRGIRRSEEHTSELQSLMRISYAVFCLKKKNTLSNTKQILHTQRHTTYTHTRNTGHTESQL